MTSPPEPIKVRCPHCRTIYTDWTRANTEHSLEDYVEEDLEPTTSSTCPDCGYRLRHDEMIVAADGTRESDYASE